MDSEQEYHAAGSGTCGQIGQGLAYGVVVALMPCAGVLSYVKRKMFTAEFREDYRYIAGVFPCSDSAVFRKPMTGCTCGRLRIDRSVGLDGGISNFRAEQRLDLRDTNAK